MGATWFTSDLHLGHVNAAIKHRGFASVDEMNELIISRWNDVVADGDEVFILGDLCMGPIKESLKLISRLAGRKVLIPGNHDRCSITHWAEHESKTKRDAWIGWEDAYREAGISSIIHAEAGAWNSIQMVFPGRTVFLSHYPPDGDHTMEERYKASRPRVPDGMWSVHGHVHDAWTVRHRMVNVGVDVWGFAPVSAQTIADVITAHEEALSAPRG